MAGERRDLAMPTQHFYSSHGLRLHYCTWGDVANPTLLLVHGAQDHCRTWDWFVDAFIEDYHIIAPDLRGHGDSAWGLGSSYSRIDYVYDLTQLVKQLELMEVTLIGHSLGGSVACMYAGIFPGKVARLVSIEGIGLWEPDEEQSAASALNTWVESMDVLSARKPRRYDSLQSACARMQKMNPGLSLEQAQHLTTHGAKQNADGSWSWKFDTFTNNWAPFGMPDEVTVSLWQNIACPTLLLNADDGFDHRTGQNDTLRYFQSGQVRVVADAGHWTYHDQLDQVTELVEQFLGANPLS